MVVGLLAMELFMPESASLKSKRSILHSLLQKIRRDWNVSAAETEHHNAWQRSLLSIASVNTSAGEVQHTLHEILKHAEDQPSLRVLDYSIEIL